MSEKELTGTDWSDREIDLIVADYFFMLGEELRGHRVNKAEHNKALQNLTGRSKGSIEFKHQNISAALDWLGEPWIGGYKPRANYQGALVDGIERFLDVRAATLSVEATGNKTDLKQIVFEAAPPLQIDDRKVPAPLRRLIRKYDPALRDARNRSLGRDGEERLFRSEIARLKLHGRRDLASKVVWTSQELGDGAGYDIHSYTVEGADRLLEVKTTFGDKTTPFYLTQNERLVSEERHDVYRIVRIYDFARTSRAFKITPPLEAHLALQPSVYLASFR